MENNSKMLSRIKEYLSVGKILWTLLILILGAFIGIYIQIQVFAHDIEELDETLGLVRQNQIRIENKIDQIIFNMMGATFKKRAEEITNINNE